MDEEGLAWVERAFLERMAPVQVEVACLADPSVCATLTRWGYVLQNFENVLGRPLPLTDAPEIGDGIDVSIGGDDESLAAWLDVVVTGFASPDTQGVPSHETVPARTIGRRHGRRRRIPPISRTLHAASAVRWQHRCAAELCDALAQERAARNAAQGRRAPGLRHRGRHDPAGLEVPGERATAGLRAALHARHLGAGGLTACG